jgi:hypothetical protein
MPKRLGVHENLGHGIEHYIYTEERRIMVNNPVSNLAEAFLPT